VTRGVEHLPSKCEALSSIPNTTTKKKKKEKKGKKEKEIALYQGMKVSKC
jgi:hypothetical protein